jgi:hypothetical protein
MTSVAVVSQQFVRTCTPQRICVLPRAPGCNEDNTNFPKVPSWPRRVAWKGNTVSTHRPGASMYGDSCELEFKISGRNREEAILQGARSENLTVL